jgi:hypothetical protein
VLNIYNIEQTPTESHPDDCFSQFTLDHASRRDTQEGVEEGLASCFKGNFVLAKICRSFSAVPFETDLMQGVADIHQ